MSLTEDQERDVERIAELETRRYFDHYLNEVFPAQVKTIREHTYVTVEKHDMNPAAHGGVEKKLNKLIWMFMGVAAAGGGTGALVAKLISAVG